MDNHDHVSDKTPKLKYSEYLDPFMEYIKPACIDIKAGLVVYRTQDEVPVDEYGQMPRTMRKMRANSIDRKFSKEEVDSMSPRKREKEIGGWGLSCNDSEEAAENSFRYTYKKLEAKGASPEDLAAFTSDRGINICRYVLTEEVGIMTPFDQNGHANLYPYENVDLEDYRDKDYGTRTINYKDYNHDEES